MPSPEMWYIENYKGSSLENPNDEQSELMKVAGIASLDFTQQAWEQYSSLNAIEDPLKRNDELLAFFDRIGFAMAACDTSRNLTEIAIGNSHPNYFDGPTAQENLINLALTLINPNHPQFAEKLEEWQKVYSTQSFKNEDEMALQKAVFRYFSSIK
jgi:hypothetical protein